MKLNSYSLISKKQYNKAKAFLELKEYNLKEKIKPTWYALMHYMQDEYPNEIKKMGSELKKLRVWKGLNPSTLQEFFLTILQRLQRFSN